MTVQEGDGPIDQFGEFSTDRSRDDGGCGQRHQPDHGADLERDGTAVGPAQDIVIKAVCLVPQGHAVRPNVHGGSGDPAKVLEQRQRLFDVDRVLVASSMAIWIMF